MSLNRKISRTGKATRQDEQKAFKAALTEANNRTMGATFWGQLYIGVIKTCWEKMTNETLPEGLVDYIMVVCEDAVKTAGGKAEGIKFDGLVISAYEQFMEKRPDRVTVLPEPTNEAGVTHIVTPGEALAEALGGEPLVVLK